MRNCRAKVLTLAVSLRKMSSKCNRKETHIRNAETYLAPNYNPLPIVLEKGKGVYVYDSDGKQYYDFLAGFATLSLGHCHPKLNRITAAQMKKLAMAPRTFHSSILSNYANTITKVFCFDKVLPTSTGNEAVETAIKIARKWGYCVKGIPDNQARVIIPENSYWGSSIAAVSSSTDPYLYKHFGPLVPSFEIVPFNNAECLTEKIKHPNVCAIVMEPIGGEAGVVLPDSDYLKKVRDLCCDHNVLMVANEVLCGLGRTGCMSCCDIYQVRPDILVVGKGLSGGLLPVSAVLADSEVMEVIEPGSHRSTFGGSPLASRLAETVLRIMEEEKIPENARDMGHMLRQELCFLPADIVTEVRGVGLLNAIVVNEEVDASELYLEMVKNGLLAQPAKDQVINLTPPLNVKEKEIRKAAQIIRKCVACARTMKAGKCESGEEGAIAKTKRNHRRKACK